MIALKLILFRANKLIDNGVSDLKNQEIVAENINDVNVLVLYDYEHTKNYLY